MESFLCEHFSVDLLRMIEYLFWEREREEDLMDASKFWHYQRYWRQKSWSFRNPIFWCVRELFVYRVHIREFYVYRVCTICRLSMYRKRTMDKIMKICFWTDDWLLKTEEGSRSPFYGLKFVTKSLVWLHYCLDLCYCLLCFEFLGHSLYSYYDVVYVGWWSEQHSYDSILIWCL